MGLDPAPIETKGKEAIERAMADLRKIAPSGQISREGVNAIRDRLIELAANRELFSLDEFPAPDASEEDNWRMYRVSEDEDGRFALYVQSSSGPVTSPPHNHKTWASIVGVVGQELNHFYDRTDDGAAKEVGSSMVEWGTGVAMLPESIHSIEIAGDALHLHCYGVALEQQVSREYYCTTDEVWKQYSGQFEITEARWS